VDGLVYLAAAAHDGVQRLHRVLEHVRDPRAAPDLAGDARAGGEAAHGSTPGGDGDDGSYPFGDSSFGTRYGAEGGGGAKAVNNGSWVEMQPAGAGGDDGGGDGGNIDGNAGDATGPGSGGGGRGGVSVSGLYSGAGADGAIIIRNSED